MGIWSKVTLWADADLAASTKPSQAPSLLVAVVPFGFGLLGFGLSDPWKELLLSIGIILAMAWAFFWFWRLLRYLRSAQYYKNLKAERDALPASVRKIVYGPSKKTYNEAKLIAIRNCAFIGTFCAAAFCFYKFSVLIGLSFPGRLTAISDGLGLFSLICALFCIFQMTTSPRQDAKLISWLAPSLRNSSYTETGVYLPDPLDPDFSVSTGRYLARKIFARRDA